MGQVNTVGRGLDFGPYMTDSIIKVDFDKLRNYRLGRARAQMEKEKLDALLLFEPHNVRYTTGFNVPTYGHLEPRWWVLVPREGKPILWGIGEMKEIYADRMPWVEIRTTPTAIDFLVAEPWYGGWEKEIVGVLSDLGIKDEPLGMDGVAGTDPFKIQEVFRKAGVTVVSAHRTMLEARRIKSEEEIQCLRMAATISEACHAVALEHIKPGIKENELVGVIHQKALSLGADWITGNVCSFGENTNPNRFGWTDRILRPGDMGYIDMIGIQFCGYRTCVYRDFTVGKASQEQKDLYKRAVEYFQAGLDQVKAGNTATDVINAWPPAEFWVHESPPQQYLFSGYAHGLGLCQYDLPRIDNVSGRCTIPPVLEENMTMAVETWTGKKGAKDAARLEEMVVVRKDGYELLSRWPIHELIECPLSY